MENIGNRIKEVIESNCETQADFALALGHDPAVITRWVRGQVVPSVINVGQICMEYQVNAHWLLFGEEK